MSLMKGKKGLIMGVANERSIAWGISQKLAEAGAELAFTYLGDALKKRVVPLAEKLNSNVTFSCDVEKKEEVVKLFEDIKSQWGEIDFVVIRENTEGEYANIGGFQYFGDSNEIGIQTGVFTKRGCERVINYAFQLARKRGNKKLVTSVTKSNAQGYGMVVWDRAFDNIARNYPDIKTESLLVDAACMDFIRKPEVLM